MKALDIVIPVYNEGENIIPVLASLRDRVKTPLRVLIVYDRDDDNTLPAVKKQTPAGLEVICVKNRSQGALQAVLTGFGVSTAPAVLVFPADDTTNAGILDAMVAKIQEGCDIVTACRFMPGGAMIGCPWLKSVLVRSSARALNILARLPSRDASNGFRLFSRRTIESIPIESTQGFCYSIELLVKCHRLGWRIGEVPARWIERKQGKSRFKVIRWLPSYLRWFFYAFATTWLGRKNV